MEEDDDRQILFVHNGERNISSSSKKVKGSDETIATTTIADNDNKAEEEAEVNLHNSSSSSSNNNNSNNNNNPIASFMTLMFLSLWMAARAVLNRTRLALSAIRQPSHVKEKMALGVVLLILTGTLVVYFGLTLKDAFIALLEAKKNQIKALGPIM